MKTLIALLILTSLSIAQAQTVRSPSAHFSAASSYWGDSERGWHFYEDPEPEPKPRKPGAPPNRDKGRSTKAPELAQLERLQKKLEEYRSIAVMNPTESNVRRYMALEAKMMSQASLFADVAQRVAWAHPEFDPTLQGRPVNANALSVWEQSQLETRSHTIGALGKDHVLFFFFRSDCPYCHAFAPTLEAFQAKHGIQIVPVSLDGGSIPGFGNPRKDNGIANTLKVSNVPAVFLAQPFTGKIIPIGFGVLSESQLLERLSAVSRPGAAEMVPGATKFIPLQ